jgi:hypothetical protein
MDGRLVGPAWARAVCPARAAGGTPTSPGDVGQDDGRCGGGLDDDGRVTRWLARGSRCEDRRVDIPPRTATDHYLSRMGQRLDIVFDVDLGELTEGHQERRVLG